MADTERLSALSLGPRSKMVAVSSACRASPRGVDSSQRGSRVRRASIPSVLGSRKPSSEWSRKNWKTLGGGQPGFQGGGSESWLGPPKATAQKSRRDLRKHNLPLQTRLKSSRSLMVFPADPAGLEGPGRQASLEKLTEGLVLAPGPPC